ncbi:MAG: hypothetical protein IJ774_12535 [Selenomonadaceae bacterium]|nr:hypothetical protein [Selenomonadaceae bacterium]
MRVIKFRGISKDTSEFVFGYYLKSGDDAQIFDGEFFHNVKPESVTQFVGQDNDGADIYEGDTVVLINGASEIMESNQFGELTPWLQSAVGITLLHDMRDCKLVLKK